MQWKNMQGNLKIKTLTMEQLHRKDWFIRRVGKIIYRIPFFYGLEDYGTICPQDNQNAISLFLSQQSGARYYE